MWERESRREKQIEVAAIPPLKTGGETGEIPAEIRDGSSFPDIPEAVSQSGPVY